MSDGRCRRTKHLCIRLLTEQQHHSVAPFVSTSTVKLVEHYQVVLLLHAPSCQHGVGHVVRALVPTRHRLDLIQHKVIRCQNQHTLKVLSYRCNDVRLSRSRRVANARHAVFLESGHHSLIGHFVVLLQYQSHSS